MFFSVVYINQLVDHASHVKSEEVSGWNKKLQKREETEYNLVVHSYGDSIGNLHFDSFTFLIMILGTHNSLTYLDSTKWWLNMFNRCQEKTLKEQVCTDGVRMIDIKLRFDRYGDVVVTNGKWESKTHWEPKRFVEWILNTMKLSNHQHMYINLTLDTCEISLSQEISFISLNRLFREHLENCEKDIIIIGGHRSFDDEKVIVTIPDMFIAFPINTCSNQCRWYEKWFPKMFARRNNEKNIKLWNKENCIVAFDYI